MLKAFKDARSSLDNHFKTFDNDVTKNLQDALNPVLDELRQIATLWGFSTEYNSTTLATLLGEGITPYTVDSQHITNVTALLESSTNISTVFDDHSKLALTGNSPKVTTSLFKSSLNTLKRHLQTLKIKSTGAPSGTFNANNHGYNQDKNNFDPTDVGNNENRNKVKGVLDQFKNVLAADLNARFTGHFENSVTNDLQTAVNGVLAELRAIAPLWGFSTGYGDATNELKDISGPGLQRYNVADAEINALKNLFTNNPDLGRILPDARPADALGGSGKVSYEDAIADLRSFKQHLESVKGLTSSLVGRYFDPNDATEETGNESNADNKTAIGNSLKRFKDKLTNNGNSFQDELNSDGPYNHNEFTTLINGIIDEIIIIANEDNWDIAGYTAITLQDLVGPTKTAYQVANAKVDAVYSKIGSVATPTDLRRVLADPTKLVAAGPVSGKVLASSFKTFLEGDFLTNLEALEIASTGSISAGPSAGAFDSSAHGYNSVIKNFDPDSTQNNANQTKVEAVINLFRDGLTALKNQFETFLNTLTTPLETAVNNVLAKLRNIAGLWNIDYEAGDLANIDVTGKTAYKVPDANISSPNGYFGASSSSLGKVLKNTSNLIETGSGSGKVRLSSLIIALNPPHLKEKLVALKNASTQGNSNGYGSAQIFDPKDTNNNTNRNTIKGWLSKFKTKLPHIRNKVKAFRDSNVTLLENALNPVLSELREIALLWDIFGYTNKAGELPDLNATGKTAYVVANKKVSDVTDLLENTEPLGKMFANIDANLISHGTVGNSKVLASTIKTDLGTLKTKLIALKEASQSGTSTGYNSTTKYFAPDEPGDPNASNRALVQGVLSTFKTNLSALNTKFRKFQDDLTIDLQDALNLVLTELRAIAQLWEFTGYADKDNELPDIDGEGLVDHVPEAAIFFDVIKAEFASGTNIEKLLTTSHSVTITLVRDFASHPGEFIINFDVEEKDSQSGFGLSLSHTMELNSLIRDLIDLKNALEFLKNSSTSGHYNGYDPTTAIFEPQAPRHIAELGLLDTEILGVLAGAKWLPVDTALNSALTTAGADASVITGFRNAVNAVFDELREINNLWGTSHTFTKLQ